MNNNVVSILNNISLIVNRYNSINKLVVELNKIIPEAPEYKPEPLQKPKPKPVSMPSIEQLDKIITQDAKGIPMPEINIKIVKDYLEKHDIIIKWLEGEKQKEIDKAKEKSQTKFIGYLNLAKKYDSYIQNLEIPDINDKYFLTKFVKTIFNNISRNPYPSGASRANHDGLNHLRSVATCAYLLSYIKDNELAKYNMLINSNDDVLKFILLASMFFSILRVNEAGAEKEEKYKIPVNIINSIFEFNITNVSLEIVQYGLSSAILFSCIIKHMNIPISITSDTQNNQIVKQSLSRYLLTTPPWTTNINKSDDLRHTLITFGHFLDHCRFPQSKSEDDLRWSQIDTAKYVKGLVKYITNDDNTKFMSLRKKLYIFEMNLLHDTGFTIKNNEFNDFISDKEQHYVGDPDFSEHYRKQLPCYNIVGTKLDNKFSFISDNFDVAFDIIFNYQKYGSELKLIKQFLPKLEPTNTIVPLYDDINLNNIQDYENNYIIKQSHASTQYVSNIIRNNIDMSIFDNLYPKWFDWHYFIVDNFVASYTKERYNYYNEVLKYKQMYNKGMFSYLSKYGLFKLTVKNYLVISILTFLILNSSFSTDINVARGFKNNVKGFTQLEQEMNDRLDTFMKYFKDNLNVNIFEVISKKDVNEIKLYMKNDNSYDVMMNNFYELNDFICSKVKPSHMDITELPINVQNCIGAADKGIMLWHVKDLDTKYIHNKIVIEPAFISTSLSNETAAGYLVTHKKESKPNKCCLINIKIPKNMPVLWVRGYGEGGKSEHELLLPPNSRFKTTIAKKPSSNKDLFFIESEESGSEKKHTIEEITVQYEGTDVYISTNKFIDVFTDYLLLINKKKTEDQLYEKYKYEMYNLFDQPKITIKQLPIGYVSLSKNAGGVYDPSNMYWTHNQTLRNHPYVDLIYQYLEMFTYSDEKRYALTYPFIYHIRILIINDANEIAVHKFSGGWSLIGGYGTPHSISRSILSLRSLAWHNANVVFNNIISSSQIILDEFTSPDHMTLTQVIKVNKSSTKLYNSSEPSNSPVWEKIDNVNINIDKFKDYDQQYFKNSKLMQNNEPTNQILYISNKPDKHIQNIVDILNTLSDFKDIIQKGEEIIPVTGYDFMNRFESEILPYALNQSLCGIPLNADDSELKHEFNDEISTNDSTHKLIIDKKVDNWKKRNRNISQLLLDLYHAFYGTQKSVIDIENDIKKYNYIIKEYNMMIQKVKPLSFKTKDIYDEFIADLINLVKDKISKFKIRIKGTSTAFYSENPQKTNHYFDKNLLDKADIDIMIEPDKSIINEFIANNQDFDPSGVTQMKNKQYSRTSTFAILQLEHFYDKWGMFKNPFLGYLIAKKPQYGQYKYLSGAPSHLNQITGLSHTGISNREINVNILKSYDYYEESVHCHLEFVHEYP